MSPPVGSASSAQSYGNSTVDLGDSTATVQLGETSVSQVANRLNLNPDDLLLANPQIKDPYQLSPGQELNLPVHEDSARQVTVAASPTPTTNAQTPKFAGPPPRNADPLNASAVKAQLDAKQGAGTLPPDEQMIKGQFGDEGLRTYQQAKRDRQDYDKLPADEKIIVNTQGKDALPAYRQQKREVQDEFTQARHTFETTGQVPSNLKHWSPIEIEKGQPMSRAERYDEMLKKHGMDHAEVGDLNDDHRDSKYLTQDEFKAEFWQREKKEYNQCSEDYIRPGKIDKCERGVDEKYGGDGFKQWRDEQETNLAARYREYQAKVDGLATSGPVSLAGRALGRAIGYGIGGDKGADKGEELGGAIGGLGDGFAGTYSDKAQMSTSTRGDYSDHTTEASHTAAASTSHETETGLDTSGKTTGLPEGTAASGNASEGDSAASQADHLSQSQVGGASGKPQAGGAPPTPSNSPSDKPREFVDTNTARTLDDARHKDASGEKLNDQEKRVLDQYRDKDVWVSHSTETELNYRGDGTKSELQVATDVKPSTDKERSAILNDLQNAGVGGGDKKGIKDQMLVRQVLLAPAPAGKTNTFSSHDDKVVSGLFRLANIPDPQNPGKMLDPAKLGMTVPDYLHNVLKQDTFDVTVQGHRMTVRPI